MGVATVVTLLTLARSMAGEAQASMASYRANVIIIPKSKDVALARGHRRGRACPWARRG